ncbi:MAG: OpgC domain-containing protein [Planctomyces sp.]|nr:OpgC domain-containing protein [Planctomyces sp.]
MLKRRKQPHVRFKTPPGEPACAASGARDDRLDLIRGLALLIIIVDHWPDAGLARFTPRAMGLSDMAEAFVFVSGVSLGLAGMRRLLRDGWWATASRAVRRALQIWGAFVLTTVGLVLLRSGPGEWKWADWGRPGSDALLLRSGAGNLGILPMYFVLVVAAPLLLRGARTHPGALTVSSLAMWACVQVWPEATALPEPWRIAWGYHPAAWQTLFVLGLLIGSRLARKRSELSAALPWRALAALAVVGTMLVMGTSVLRDAAPETTTAWARKSTLGPLRLAHFGGLAALGVVACSLWPTFARRWWLAPLRRCGQWPLTVFCTGELFVAMAIARRSPDADGGGPGLAAALVACIAAAEIAQVIRGRFKRTA